MSTKDVSFSSFVSAGAEVDVETLGAAEEVEARGAGREERCLCDRLRDSLGGGGCLCLMIYSIMALRIST